MELSLRHNRPGLSHEQARELIRRRLGDPRGGAGGELAALRGHLRECSDCRTFHDRHLALHRAAAGGDPSQPLGIESRLLFDETMARLGTANPAPAVRPGWLSWHRLLSPVALAGVAAAVLFLMLSPVSRVAPPADERRPAARGGGEELPEAALGLSGVDAQGGEYEVVASGAVCLRHALRFYLTERAGSRPFFFLFGLQAGAAPLWYFPDPEEGRSLPLDGTPALTWMVPWEIELAHRHQPGELVVVALFSAKPLELAQVEQWLAPLQRSHQAPSQQALALAGTVGREVVTSWHQTSIIDCPEGGR